MNVQSFTQDDQHVSLAPPDHREPAVASETRRNESLHGLHTTTKNNHTNETDDHPFHPSMQALLLIQPSASLPCTSTDQMEALHSLETTINQAFSDYNGKTTRAWGLSICLLITIYVINYG